MTTRKPIVAGQFYPGRESACIDEIKQCIHAGSLPRDLPQAIVAGIVPHAGWTFSGSVAALVFSAIKKRHPNVQTFIILGAAHGYFAPTPAIYDAGSWNTPLGDLAIDQNLARTLLDKTGAVSDLQAHSTEHSIEVQMPFIKYLFGSARILPIIVPPNADAVTLGKQIGDLIASSNQKIVCIGSTDLTHYGPRYGFTPLGTGPNALQWAKDVNDQLFIDAALNLDAEKILQTAAKNANACGPGAAAATVAAAKTLHAPKGRLLAHTNSSEVMLQIMGTSSAESVGYAAIVF